MRNRRLKAVSLAVTMLGAAGVYAHSTGMTAHSGREGGVFCSECHNNCPIKGTCALPTVEFTGPATMAPGEIADFKFVVTGGPGAKVDGGAGFDVAASGGVLSATDKTIKLSGDELTHTTPHKFNGGSAVTFNFKFKAPSSTGDYTIFGAGNSVNLNGSNAGDVPAKTTFTVTVAGAEVDSGTPETDAGIEVDAGTSVDAGNTTPADSGHPGNTSGVDAGTGSGTASGCSTTGGGSAFAVLGLGLAAFLARRKQKA
jgi:uncharacterized protein (TIGR03382 family)